MAAGFAIRGHWRLQFVSFGFTSLSASGSGGAASESVATEIVAKNPMNFMMTDI